jgi:hypothetical protein
MTIEILCSEERNAKHSHLCEEKRVEKNWDEWMIHFLYHCQNIYKHLGTPRHLIAFTMEFLIFTLLH